MTADVCDGIDLKWMNSGSAEEDNVANYTATKVMAQDLSIRERLRCILFRNVTARLGGRVFDILVKIVMCLLYVFRVVIDDYKSYECGGIPCGMNSTFVQPRDEDDGMAFSSAEINWHVLLWIYRPLPLWITHLILATATFTKALLFIFVSKGRRMESITHSAFVLEFICSFPLIVTLVKPALLKDLFVPCFLNCWLAKMALERLFNDIHLTKQRFQTISVTMFQQLMILIATLCCLIFTTVCGIQHIQRASSEKPLTMFESFYFVIVTFSTVGYGDISPDIWLGQLFMILMICIAIAFIPRQIEGIASTWAEKNKAGGEYGKRQARKNKHVVVCSHQLTADATMDFLTEFYAHPKLEEHTVILLSSTELDSNMQTILRDPKWANRVIFMRGSALKNLDLSRCRMNEAEACFLLAPGNCKNKDQADQHTILRSWAIKDFSPSCNQYIQIFRAENKMHVKFAEHVVCEDEFSYALLANNCLYPGLSTLVSLLVHTSTGYEGHHATEPWMKIYGAHSGNEIYHIQLGKSMFFKDYEGQPFTLASAEAHSKYGITLMAVMEMTDSNDSEEKPKLLLNPGSDYILKASDFCFYLSITKEEYSTIKPNKPKHSATHYSAREQSYKKMAENLHRIMAAHELEEDSDCDGEESVFNTITSTVGADFRNITRPSGKCLTIPDTPDVLQPGYDEIDTANRSHNIKNLWLFEDMGLEECKPANQTPQLLEVISPNHRNKLHDRYVKGPPPTFLTGARKTICHLVKHRRHDCCLKWGEDCSHVTYKHANDSRWQHQLIILAAEQFCLGLYNFIVPLRSEFIGIKSLSPIIIMLENDPEQIFLETIAQFPMVYWLKGRVTHVDDLIKAGITKASHLVIVNRSSNMDVEEVLVDSETIVAVQMVFKLFPSTNIITELTQTSNMKFMQFQPHDEYSQKIARLEKKLSERMRSSLTHIFRSPFAAGHVFSSSMLDTLLYQTFVKGYLIKFVRLLLGIDAEQNSGHLSSIKVKRDILRKYRTYGDLYKGLCSITGEIPIAIYRSEAVKRPSEKECENDHSDNNNKGNKGNIRPKKLSFNIKQFYERAEQNDISDLIRSRLKSQSMDTSHYNCEDVKAKPLSYIIINPLPTTRLKSGDIVYVIQPHSMNAIPSRLHQHKYVRRMSWTEGNMNFSSQPDKGSSSPVTRSRSQSVDHTLGVPVKTVDFCIPGKASLDDNSPIDIDKVFPANSSDSKEDIPLLQHESGDTSNTGRLPMTSSAKPNSKTNLPRFTFTEHGDEFSLRDVDTSDLYSPPPHPPTKFQREYGSKYPTPPPPRKFGSQVDIKVNYTTPPLSTNADSNADNGVRYPASPPPPSKFQTVAVSEVEHTTPPLVRPHDTPPSTPKLKITGTKRFRTERVSSSEQESSA